MLMSTEEKWAIFNEKNDPEFRRFHLKAILDVSNDLNELWNIYRISLLFGCRCETETLEKILEYSSLSWQIDKVIENATENSKIWKLANQKRASFARETKVRY